ncbi:hypothetical protein SLA2020_188390 [Shorea laevis]
MDSWARDHFGHSGEPLCACYHIMFRCHSHIDALQALLDGGSRFSSVLYCIGLSNLNHEASTTKDGRELCHCLNDAALGFGVIPKRAKELPQKCGVQTPVPIEPDIDCDM